MKRTHKWVGHLVTDGRFDPAQVGQRVLYCELFAGRSRFSETGAGQEKQTKLHEPLNRRDRRLLHSIERQIRCSASDCVPSWMLANAGMAQVPIVGAAPR